MRPRQIAVKHTTLNTSEEEQQQPQQQHQHQHQQQQQQHQLLQQQQQTQIKEEKNENAAITKLSWVSEGKVTRNNNNNKNNNNNNKRTAPACHINVQHTGDNKMIDERLMNDFVNKETVS